tara:strand:+ start:3067 stop:3588 length:522 start_codon:yes stop_codon:yes gene_type:complete
MNENLKKRFIGVLIFLAASLIIAPLLFKGSGQKELKFSTIESQKNIAFKNIDKTNNIEEEISVSSKKLEVKEKKVVIKNEKELINQKNNGKINWVIRIGSFEKKENALNQISLLQEINYKTFILKFKKSDKTMYAVNVGPFFTASETKKNFLEIIQNANFSDSYIIEMQLKNN